MIVELSKYKVTIKDIYTWGDKEAINAIVTSSAKVTGKDGYAIDGEMLRKSKIALIERMVVKIEEGEKVIPYSEDWLNNLSAKDGDKLYDSIEEVSKKK